VSAEAEAASPPRPTRALMRKAARSGLISPGNAHDVTCAEALLDGSRNAVVIAGKGYDTDRTRAYIKAQGAFANIPNRCNRREEVPVEQGHLS
jgi:IS5 family transposase